MINAVLMMMMMMMMNSRGGGCKIFGSRKNSAVKVSLLHHLHHPHTPISR